MRIVWYMGAIFIGIVLSKCGFSSSIKFDETEFHFGEINQNTEVKHIFKFKNAGNDTLVIKNVRAP